MSGMNDDQPAVEITDAMIEAGVDALCRWDVSEDAELVVWSVFTAMISASRGRGGALLHTSLHAPNA